MDDGQGQTGALPGDAEGATSTPAVWLYRSTGEAPARDRFDFWRHLQIGSHMVCPLAARADFFADYSATTAPGGIGFAAMRLDPCVSRFGPGGDDTMVDIGIIAAGSMHIRYGRDQTLTLNAAAGPVLFDAARPMTTVTTRCNLVYLHLPRAAVVTALGAGGMAQIGVARALPRGALATQLMACLRGLHAGSAASAASVGATLGLARALALVALAKLRGEGHHWEGGLDDALHAAAQHQLAQGLADPRLTADAVAGVLGCSRARLYRLFAARGETVAGDLRELRLRHAATLLRASSQAPISAIAADCGYGEPVAFAKAFRRRFGLAPRAWQTLAV